MMVGEQNDDNKSGDLGQCTVNTSHGETDLFTHIHILQRKKEQPFVYVCVVGTLQP